LVLIVIALVAATLAAVNIAAPIAEAQGPPYNGPQTDATGPAYFGPAPNPVPYCESPTYFDPFPENVNPVGRLDVGGGTEASVTTNGITMDFNITAEGDPGGQYPGFFPAGGEGGPNDQPKGVEMAAGDEALVELSAPLFYSQWVFTDVDRENEGFFVTPTWTDPDAEIAIFAGDANFEFDGSSNSLAAFNDTDTVGLDSEDIGGRVQVDMLGAVTGISMVRDTGSGQSGFAVGGGCEAAGAAKRVASGPTWNGSSFDVTFELRVRNNLPSGATVAAAILAAQQNAPADFLSGAPSGIPLRNLQLNEPLGDAAFADISIVSVVNPNGTLPLNPNYDGLVDTDLLSIGALLPAETDELITLELQYTPDLNQNAWDDCAAGYTYLNQATVSASAANVEVSDQSDDGDNPAPGNDNGVGGVNDVTEVVFPCPPAGLDIVKTVVEGPNGTCPDFAGGIVGDGPVLDVIDQDTVTYCISVTNPGTFNATNVVISDPQNPNGDIAVGTLPGQTEQTFSYDVQVDLNTPRTNTATAVGLGPDGALPAVSDTAVIGIGLLPQPELSLVKTVIAGPNGTCPDFDGGINGVGPALIVDEGDTVTYCLSVRNTGPGDATNVIVTDPQAPADFDGDLGLLLAGDDSAPLSFDVTVTLVTPALNTATVTGVGPYGAVAPDSDDALIDISALPDPSLAIVKTVIAGPNGVCPAFADGVIGAGAALPVLYGETVTYCISVANQSGSAATNVVVTDPQAPAGFDGDLGTIPVGEERSLSYDILVDAATPALNTATVNGSGPNGPVPADSDQAVIDPSPQPDPVLEIVKTVVAGPGGTCPATFDDGVQGLGTALPVQFDDTVTYCLTVRNASGSDATDVLISDPQAPAGFDGAIGDLAVGAEATRSFDLVVDAATPNVNTAAVGGSGPNGPVPDDTDQALISSSPQPNPVLQIVKTVVPGPNGTCPATLADGVDGLGAALPAQFGSTVTYCLNVRNDAGTTAENVTITDAQAPAGFDGLVGTLAVGAEDVRSFDLVVDAGTPSVNTATVTGTGPNGAAPADSDQAQISASPQPNPVLQIVKTVVAGPNGTCPATLADGVDGLGAALPAQFDSTVTYCLNVRNDAGSDATDVVVSDAQAPAGFDGAIGDLAVGAEVVLSYDVVVTAATPEVNTATVAGNGPNGAAPVDSDQAQINASPQPNPVLQIVKTVVPGPNGTCPATLADGVDGLGAALPAQFDSTVTYCLNVRNDAGTAATDVLISDSQAPVGFDGAIGDLAVGAEAARSYDVVVDANTPEVNTALVTGNGPNGAVPTDSDQAQINASPQPDPVLQIVKTVVAGPNGTCPATLADGVDGLGASLAVLFGDTVTYCLNVRNDAGTDATDVVVSDSQAPVGFDGAIGDLAVGAEATRSYDVVVDANTPEVNTATVTGNGPNGAAPGDTDQARIVSSPLPDPILDIVKTVVPGPNGVCPGYEQGVQGVGPALTVLFNSTVTYCLSIFNSGLSTATDVVISDIQAPAGFNGFIGDLPIETERTVTFDKVVDGQTPVLNTARVDGDGPNGPVAPDSDQAAIQPAIAPEPRLEIIKTVVAGPNGTCPDYDNGIQGVGPALPVLFGQVVTYCMSITNLGLDTATDVIIRDSQAPAGFDGMIGTLVVGAEATRSFDLTVSAATPEVNTALVSGVGPNGPVPGDSDTAQISTSPLPQPVLDIVKTAIAGPGGICPAFADGIEGVGAALDLFFGETVTYCLTVQNTGLGDATNVVVTDSQAPASFEGTIGDLAAGDEVTLTIDVEVDQGTPEVNIATVTGDGPNGPVDPDNDLARIEASPVLLPQLSVVKTVVEGPAGSCPSFEDGVVGIGPGLEVMITDAVTYCISVRNVGDGAATDVVINDPQADAEIVVGDLAPGATFDTTYDLTVTAATPLINTAVASGQGPEGSVNAEDSAQIVATAQLIPSITLTNTVVPINESCNDAVESVDEFVLGALGDGVRWCFEVTNTGNTSLTDLVFDNPPLSLDQLDVLANFGNGGLSLPPGASIRFSSEGTIPENGVVSLSSVVGTPSDAAGVPIADLGQVDDQNDAAVDEAGVSLVKLVAEGADADCSTAVEDLEVNAGTSVTWCFVVTNTGNVDLQVTEVVDEQLGLTIAIPVADQVLAPDESVTVTAVTIVDDPIENVASVEGTPLDADGDPFPDPPVIADDDSARVVPLRADLSIVKTSSTDEPVEPGTELTYRLTVTNLGPSAANDVVVSDLLPEELSYVALPAVDGWACTAVVVRNSDDDGDLDGFMCVKDSPMQVGEQFALEYTVLVAADVDQGIDLTNTASISSSTPDPDPTNNNDDETTSTVVPTPPPTPTPPPGIEFPGPFDDPVEPEEEPDEVLELVITGASSRLLVLLSMLMLMLGAVLQVAGRRRGSDHN
jgi:uncharacterized repeat protein (TIGR01451 family)